jgi:hypothetical protein
MPAEKSPDKHAKLMIRFLSLQSVRETNTLALERWGLPEAFSKDNRFYRGITNIQSHYGIFDHPAPIQKVINRISLSLKTI